MTPLLHPCLVNDRFGDPALYIEFKFEKRALLFDLSPVSAYETEIRKDQGTGGEDRQGRPPGDTSANSRATIVSQRAAALRHGTSSCFVHEVRRTLPRTPAINCTVCLQIGQRAKPQELPRV